MKKFIFSFVLLCTTFISVNAQIMRAEELENYAKEKYGEKWTEAAANLGKELALDKNNSLTYMRIPVDTRSPIPVISVQSVGDLQYRWQS